MISKFKITEKGASLWKNEESIKSRIKIYLDPIHSKHKANEKYENRKNLNLNYLKSQTL